MVNKILIIDDDESILDAISLTLEDADYTVATSTKGDETYKKVTEFVPDLIILDVLMSGSDSDRYDFGSSECKRKCA
jgi:DNA-binding response OmpR family regulator